MLAPVDIKFFKLAVGTDSMKEHMNDIVVRCPVCGDSQKKRNSRRLHLYEKSGVTNVNCFNGDCPVHNKTVYSFLRDFYPALLSQYKRETFGDTIKSLKGGTTLGEKIKVKKEIPVNFNDLTPYIHPITEAGIDYLAKRGITYNPNKFGKWYFGYQNLKIKETVYPIIDSIIVPLYYEDNMYGFYSRSIKDKTFVTYMDESNIGYKLWNWFNVDKDEPVYIFEGIFDAISSGKKNIIALMGAKLPDERLKELKQPVFCLDNDRTGLLNALNYTKQGYKVYIQPKNILEKDFNELMLNRPELNLPELIDENTFYGISAEVRIKAKL